MKLKIKRYLFFIFNTHFYKRWIITSSIVLTIAIVSSVYPIFISVSTFLISFILAFKVIEIFAFSFSIPLYFKLLYSFYILVFCIIFFSLFISGLESDIPNFGCSIKFFL